MGKNEDEVSLRSGESVDSLTTMEDTEITASDAQRRRTACAWERSQRAFGGERGRIQAGVVAQSIEGDRIDSLWRVMNVIEGGRDTPVEAQEVRARVIATVQERWKAGELQEPLPPGEAGWQEYIQKVGKGRRMGGAPEVEAWATGGGYRVAVYRETKDGTGYRKIQEFGDENGVRAGILWKKTRVYEVVWEQGGAVKRSTTGEGGEDEACRGALAQANVGSEREHSVTCSDSRPSACDAGSVGSAQGSEVEQQRKAAWAWKRREDALEGARERTGDGVLVEHMYGKEVDSLWVLLCALEGRPSSEEELAKIRQGVAARVESRHTSGTMEESLPQEEVSWQRCIQRTRQGKRMGGPTEVEAWATEGGYKVAVYRETKSGEGYRKLVEYGDGTPLDAGILWTKRRVHAFLWGVRGSRSDADEVAEAGQWVLDSAQDGQEWPAVRPDRARRQVIPGDGKCLYWAISAVEGKGGQAAADEIRTALTEGDMARPPEAGWARRVMRDAGVQTWEQSLDKVRKGEIWGGACEVGRWAQRRGCKIALYREWGPKWVYRKMAEVGEGRRTAAALLWSRRGGGHYELLWRPEEEEAAQAGEGDGNETADVEEVGLEVEDVDDVAEDIEEVGMEAEGQGLEGGGQGEQAEERVWRDVHHIQIQEGGEGWRYQGQEGPMRERREVGEGNVRDRKLRAGWEGVLGVQVQEMRYEEVPEGTGKGEWIRRQEGGVDL